MTYYLSKLIGKVELTQERVHHILAAHPEMKQHIRNIKGILKNPVLIRRSKIDPDSLLFYGYFGKINVRKYIVVAVKRGKRNFILTAYITNKIKAGEVYETEKK